MTSFNQEELDKLIQEKTKKLDDLIREMNGLKQKLSELGPQSLKLDGAISQLKELKENAGGLTGK